MKVSHRHTKLGRWPEVGRVLGLLSCWWSHHSSSCWTGLSGQGAREGQCLNTGFGIWSIGLEEGCECPHVSNALSSSNTCEAKPQNLLVHSFRAFWASPWMWYWDIAFLSQEKYDEYTLEERAKIGRYGAENGPGKSTRQVLDTKRLPWGLLCGGYIISLRSHHQKSKHTSF